MDSLQRCEMSYSDALCPAQREMNNSFMGQHKLMRPATYNDLQQFTSMVVSAINTSLATYATFPPTLTQPAQCLHVPCFNTSSQAPLAAATNPTPASAPTSEPAAPSIARARIPNIPRGKDNWRKAVEQWDELLRAWPAENYKGAMRTKTGTKRSSRQIIAEEYDR